MKFSSRLDKLAPYPFVEISRIIAKKRAEGVEIVTFGIGDPDIPTPDPIVDRLIAASRTPANHRYPETDGLPEVREAIAAWYKSRFGVDDLDPASEVLPLHRREGGHRPRRLLLPRPRRRLPHPRPRLPRLRRGHPLRRWRVLRHAPNWRRTAGSPTSQPSPPRSPVTPRLCGSTTPTTPPAPLPKKSYYEEAIAFAREYDVGLLHDAAYSEVVFDGYKALSFLEVEGAKDVGIEFHSLSKCFNMTGWRFGSAVGNSDMIQALFTIKSNLDSGIPQAIQEMAIEALTGPQDHIDSNNAIYQVRRDKVMDALIRLGLGVVPPKAALYLWAKVPPGYSSESFTARLLDDLALVVTPGSSYGEHGEGYIRLSLTTPDDMIDKGVDRLNSWKIPEPPGA